MQVFAKIFGKIGWAKNPRSVHMDLIITRRAFCVGNSPYVLIVALIGSDSLFCNRGTSPACEWMIYVTICFVLIIIWLSLFVWWLSMSGSILSHTHARTHTHAHTQVLCTLTSLTMHTHRHTPMGKRNFVIIELPPDHCLKTTVHIHTPHSFKNWPNYDYKQG